MKIFSSKLLFKLIVPGTCLFALGGCLGPNPGFFITTTVSTGVIMNLVNNILNSLLTFP